MPVQKKTHERIKRVESYKKVWQNLYRYASHKNPLYNNNVSSKYVIVPDFNDIESEINLWIEKSAESKISFLILNADNRIYENSINSYQLEKIVLLIDSFIKKAESKNIRYIIYTNILSAYKYLDKPLPENSNYK